MGRRRKDQSPPEDELDCKTRYGANARERDRMRVLSKGFSKLKTTLPWVPPDTKLSKLDTLRLATCYIAHLRQILAEEDDVTAKGADITCYNNNMSARCDMTPQNTRCDATRVTDSNGYAHPLNLTWPYSFNKHDTHKPVTSPTPISKHNDVLHMTTSQAVTKQEMPMS